jgi:hypothetical protein
MYLRVARAAEPRYFKWFGVVFVMGLNLDDATAAATIVIG